MPSLYRYHSRKYNDSFLSEGNLRIGTLHDFRKTEHKKGVSDPLEGHKKISHVLSDCYDADDQTCSDSLAMEMLGFIQGNTVTNFKIRGGPTIVNRIVSPNYFIFCLASVKSMSIFDSLEGSETCVEIEDVRLFFNRLTYALNNLIPVKFLGCYSVVYKERSEVFNGKDRGDWPGLIKTPDFSGQYEVRAIWEPIGKHEIDPIVITDKKLRRYLRPCPEIDVAMRWDIHYKGLI